MIILIDNRAVINMSTGEKPRLMHVKLLIYLF